MGHEHNMICVRILQPTKEQQPQYPVDIEVWSKLAQRARIKRIASKFARDFDCNWQRVSAIPIALLWHTFYFRKLSLTQLQKGWFLLLWNVRMIASWFMYRSFYFILQGQQSVPSTNISPNLKDLHCLNTVNPEVHYPIWRLDVMSSAVDCVLYCE